MLRGVSGHSVAGYTVGSGGKRNVDTRIEVNIFSINVKVIYNRTNGNTI